MKKRSEVLFNKSISAAVSAIELYNKPDFKYREESFIILLVNAWELLFKAKILQENNNKLTSLYLKVAKKNSKGDKTKKMIYDLNRSDGKKTIGLFEAIKELDKKGFKVDEKCFENIEAITEIRNNAIHLCNSEKLLNKKIQEVGTASLKNYLTLIKKWFDEKFSNKLSNFNFYLMPLSFFNDFSEVDGINLSSKNKETENLIKYLAAKEKNNPYAKDSEFQMSVKVDLKLTKSDTEGNAKFSVSRDVDAIKIQLSDEERERQFPHSYAEMCAKVKSLINDKPHIKIGSSKFHQVKVVLEKNTKLCYERFLDIKKQNGQKKKFYNENFASELIRNYKK
jgi:hypothetical protein